jgi:hypothetical protein
MHRRLSRAVPIGVILFAGLLVAGCGSSSTTTTAAISKAEFVAKGNASCVANQKKQQAEFTAYAKKHGFSEKTEPTKAQQTELVDAVFVPNVQTQINYIKALGAPSGEEQQVTAALETAQTELTKVKANPELIFSKQDPFKATGEKLHALGLTQCAKGES